MTLPPAIVCEWERRYRGIILRPLVHLPTHLTELREQGVDRYWHAAGGEMVDRGEWLIWLPALETVDQVALDSLQRYCIYPEHIVAEYHRWVRLGLAYEKAVLYCHPETRRLAEIGGLV